MTITRTPIVSREQWLNEMRPRNIGASEAAALPGLNCHEYLTPYQLWAKKSGKLPPDLDSAPKKRGRKLEPVAIEMIAEEFPAWKLEQPNAYFADESIRLGATPDLLATDPTHGPGVIQIKSVEPGVFRRHWFEGDEPRPPLWIAVQALVEAHLTGAKWAAVAALVVSFGIDLHVVDIPMHGGVIQKVRDEAAQFWRLVESGRAPDPDFGRDLVVLRQLLGADDGSEIDLSSDNEVPDIVARRAAAGEQIKVAQATYDTCTGMLLHKMGAAQIARFNGGYITAKTTQRKEYTVKATSYRALRVKRTDEAA